MSESSIITSTSRVFPLSTIRQRWTTWWSHIFDFEQALLLVIDELCLLSTLIHADPQCRDAVRRAEVSPVSSGALSGVMLSSQIWACSNG